MLRAIIIDDEQPARQGLATLLELYCPQVQVAGDANTIDKGITLIRQWAPDVVFLDIQIGEQNGFQLLDQLKQTDFQLIFTTAYSDFAVKAFRYHAVDYLLKPIQPQQLLPPWKKAGSPAAPESWSGSWGVVANAEGGQAGENRRAHYGGLHYISVENIVHVAGSANYSTFHLDSGEKVMASKNLKYYEELLPKDTFFRAHQSHLVNLRYIKQIKTLEGNTVELEDGAGIPLAKARKGALMERLKGRS
ncbi:MAG: response regulator transcription factor [Lewinellaceae bacterium]|nr:response regulator transcription factor [Lewinellaceae bacterium]